MATPTSIYEQEHEDFRQMVRTFLEKEVVPFHDQWEKDGHVDREVWRKAGATGLLAFDVEEQYGGLGLKDFRYNAVVTEEISFDDLPAAMERQENRQTMGRVVVHVPQ